MGTGPGRGNYAANIIGDEYASTGTARPAVSARRIDTAGTGARAAVAGLASREDADGPVAAGGNRAGAGDNDRTPVAAAPAVAAIGRDRAGTAAIAAAAAKAGREDAVGASAGGGDGAGTVHGDVAAPATRPAIATIANKNIKNAPRGSIAAIAAFAKSRNAVGTGPGRDDGEIPADEVHRE